MSGNPKKSKKPDNEACLLCEDLLAQMQRFFDMLQSASRTSEADWLTVEDIAEELLGPIETAEGIEPVESIGPFEYRLAGDISIHDWAEAFGIDPEEAKITTIGGLVTVLLGKIPKSGDVAYLQNLKFTVERVRKHRIKTVILTFEAPGTNGQ